MEKGRPRSPTWTCLWPRAAVLEARFFDGPADKVYLGTGNTYTLRGEGRFAICGARASRRLPNRRVAAADVPVELRGAGNCSRQVHNFGTAGVFEADSLIACEVITPGGNWSSYPAHKHDENSPVESQLEEIYYFEIAAGPGASAGFGYHRVYGTPDRPIEVLEEVRTGDVVLVPHTRRTRLSARRRWTSSSAQTSAPFGQTCHDSLD